MDCGPRMRFVVAGGRIVHNCVQAISRDILMEASLRLNALGYRTVHRVHDELIISVPKGEGKNLVREENKVWKGIAIEELSRVPAWAPGMPLGAEGIVSERYGLH